MVSSGPAANGVASPSRLGRRPGRAWTARACPVRECGRPEGVRDRHDSRRPSTVYARAGKARHRSGSSIRPGIFRAPPAFGRSPIRPTAQSTPTGSCRPATTPRRASSTATSARHLEGGPIPRSWPERCRSRRKISASSADASGTSRRREPIHRSVLTALDAMRRFCVKRHIPGAPNSPSRLGGRP